MNRFFPLINYEYEQKYKFCVIYTFVQYIDTNQVISNTF